MIHRRPEIAPRWVIGLSALLLVSVLSPWPSPAGATQWTGGLPEGGFVGDMAVDPTAPSTVYADGTPVWRSTDSGASWSPTNVASASGRGLIADAGGVLYYVSNSTTPTVFYRSDDGGDTWTEIDPGAGETPRVVAVDPSDTSILYVGTRNAGIFKSTDTGGTWGAINTGLGDVNGLRIVSILVDPSTSNTVYAASRQVGVFKTIDGGANWAAANTGLDPLPFEPTLLIDPVTPANVYVASRSGVFKSVDGGANWADASTGLPDPDDNSLAGFALDSSTPSTLYAGGLGEIYATSNGGTSWAALGTGLPGVTVRAIVVDPTTSLKVYAGTDEGIVASTDGGTSWQDANSGFHNYYAADLIVDPTDAERLLARDNGTGVYGSTDSAATWQSLNGDLPFLSLTSLAMAPGAPQTLFTSTFTEIYRSLDGGATWSPRLADPGQFGFNGPDISIVEIEDATGTNLLTGNTAFNIEGLPLPPGVLRSTDGGANWSAFYTPDDIPDLGFFWFPWSIAIDPADADRVFAGSFHRTTGGPSELRVVRTEDGGASWDEVFTGGFGRPTVVVDPFDPDNVYIGVFGIDQEPDEVYKSTDGGDSFVPLGVGALCVWTIALHPTRADSLYASCSNTVRVSEDGGTTWSDVSPAGLPANPLDYVADALAVGPGAETALHLGTYMGVYSRTWEVDIFADGFESGDTSAWSNTVP